MLKHTLKGLLVLMVMAMTTLFTSDQNIQADPPCNECPPGWFLEGEHFSGKDWDKNGDGLVCYKWLDGKGHGNDKDLWEHIVHKDNLPCKD